MRKITFKSEPDNYIKEEDGRKSNTVRFTDDWDKERWDDYYYATNIEIVNTLDLTTFIRRISDKTTYKNVAIISWKHPSSNSQ